MRIAKRCETICIGMVLCFCLAGCGNERVTNDKLIYHNIKTDAEGKIVPWYSPNPGRAYGHVINLVWNFWHNMRRDYNGLPYYMSHQVWKEGVNDRRGLGGDQLQMALSSWALLYAYSGDERLVENMKFMADYYLAHSLSGPDCKWPNIPYPYNTNIYSGIYDGDMILGRGYTQPDKAGSFGIELITLYKISGNENYLDAAVKIADTLAMHTKEGDNDNSPLPFKVQAQTGEVGVLMNNSRPHKIDGRCTYTTNWTGTMRLFTELIRMNKGDVASYKKAFDIFLVWMKEYPLKTNKWGPFFEDIPGWSDTQINAVTFAMYIMENPDLFPNWKQDARKVLDWPSKKLANRRWEKYGVIVVNEQTQYLQPGNSHTSRQASMELLYAKLTGDTTWKENAVRQLNWATYMVDGDGKNRYPNDDIWMTDGYGDYVRHYLRAIAACSELAPDDEDHLLGTTSVIKNIKYEAGQIRYMAFDEAGTEVLRLTSKPTKVMAGKKKIAESDNLNETSWTWQGMDKGGVLRIRHDNDSKVVIEK